jgi:hypothetical protein
VRKNNTEDKVTKKGRKGEEEKKKGNIEEMNEGGE